MGLSLVHFILFVVIVGVVFGPGPFHRAGLGVGDFWRNFKRSLDGKDDVDITATVKREIDGD